MYPGKLRTVQLLIQQSSLHLKDPLSAGRMQFQVKIFLPDKQSIQDQLTKNKYVYQIKLKHQGMISKMAAEIDRCQSYRPNIEVTLTTTTPTLEMVRWLSVLVT